MVRISGRVQGVGFRWFTRERARECGVRGYVRNLDDGRVEVFAQAERDALEVFLAELREGPPASRVAGLDSEPASVDGSLSSFEVRL